MGGCHSPSISLEAFGTTINDLTDEILLILKGLAVSLLCKDALPVIVKLACMRANLMKHYRVRRTHAAELISVHRRMESTQEEMAEAFLQQELAELTKSRDKLASLFKSRTHSLFYSADRVRAYEEKVLCNNAARLEHRHMKWVIKKRISSGESFQSIAEVFNVSGALTNYNRFIEEIASLTTHRIVRWRPCSVLEQVKPRASKSQSPIKRCRTTPGHLSLTADLTVVGEPACATPM